MDKQITIRMPKKLLADWLAALRSGKYEQCQGAMTDGVGFCCLGILAAVSAGRADAGGKYPDPDWMGEAEISFFDHDGTLRHSQPWLPPIKEYAGNANDDGKSFAELADAIEACAEGV